MNAKPLTISIDGPGVDPATIRLRDLYEVLHAFEAATNAIANPEGGKTTSIDFHLTEIRPGSATYVMTTSEEGYAAAIACAEAVARSDVSTLPARAKEALIALRMKSRKTGWSFRWQSTEETAVLQADTEFVEDPCISGGTTVAGRIERVGGTLYRTAALSLLSGQRITAQVASEELARQLGARLYEVVSLRGDATWTTGDDLRIVAFRITGIEPYRSDANVLGTLRALRETAGDFWDAIDPDEYIRDLRSETW